MSIILKDAANADVVYVESRRYGNSVDFIHMGANLLERSRIVLTLNENGKTNRVLGKLSIPTVQDDSNGVPTVVYTEVGSFDLSSVLVADAAVAEDFMAQFGSLIANQAVKLMYTTGARP